MPRFILGLLILFVLELITLIKVGGALGALNTVVLMIVAAAAGCALIKLRLRNLMQQWVRHQSLNLDLLWMPLAGFLFIFPGFISDILALLLLLPPVDNLLARLLAGKVMVKGHPFADIKSDKSNADHIVEASFTVEEERSEPKSKR